ncbi:fimbria/pilus outer membrane usher protein [Rhizobium halophytocola]|nr:fimbria/pilus outer membrane usher protein [Rhizobium halophytocola]
MRYHSGLALFVAGCVAFAASANGETGSGENTSDPADPAASTPVPDDGLDLYLSVSVNGQPTDLVASFHQSANGKLSIEVDELRSVGITPAKSARAADGRILIDRLPHVRYVFDEAQQTIDFVAADAQRAPKVIDARPSQGAAEKKPRLQAQSVTGALLNYRLTAATDNSAEDGDFSFTGLSGSFEARLFGPLGVLDNTFIASTSGSDYYGTKRLDTTWRYSSESSMTTFSVGDVITGGLSWTRPTRLGGVQIQRNFALRSDLVTFPVPELSGSAAVPSTVDVYLNSIRRYSGRVDAGPFQIDNLPIVDGTGNAQVVVTDAQGQQVTTNSSFITSNRLLAPGLKDFSAEIGFARQGYGSESDRYDPRPYGSATLRWGLTDWLTAEAHVEGGADLVNGGLGFVFATEPTGVISLSASGSYHDGEGGQQIAVSLERQFGELHLSGRIQRVFGTYDDIASVTATSSGDDTEYYSRSIRPPRALEQVSASIPLPFSESRLNLSFAHEQTDAGSDDKFLSLSTSRRVFNDSTLSLSFFKDLGGRDTGVFASLLVPLGERTTSSTSVSSQSDDFTAIETVSRTQGQQVGDYGWSISRQQSDDAVNSASASYRSAVGQVSGRVDQRGSSARASVSVDGAVVAAGGGLFAANRIEDAFAVVDAGAPGVDVQYENRPAGKTNRNGKLLLPKLRAYQANNVSIDPANLPLDAVVNDTRQKVVPADRSGVVVKFDVDTHANAALVTFRSANGQVIEMGASGTTSADADPFVVGYDGQALVEQLKADNRITITRQDGSTCVATFSYKPDQGQQVAIPDAVCKP